MSRILAHQQLSDGGASMISKPKFLAEVNKLVEDAELITADTSDDELQGLVQVFSAQLFAAREEQRRQLKSVKAKQAKAKQI